VRKKERKKIDAFELWTWRRILRVPLTEKRTNLSVLEEVKPKRSLEPTILRLKLRYFGHVMRANGVTGAGHYAWTSRRIQGARKPTNTMA